MNNEFSFNEDFCSYLEYHLSRTFAHSDRQDINGYWCDGISCHPIPASQLTFKSVNDTRRIITKAWIGVDGQDEYEMIIILGKYSLRRYAKGIDFKDCIPSEESMDWVDIDIDNYRIEVKLK